MPTAYRSGPDSIVASKVTVISSPGVQVVGPAINLSVPMRTSFAVHDGLFNPVAGFKHIVSAVPANAAPAQPSKASPDTIPRKHPEENK
jgi:hypothetical protein